MKPTLVLSLSLLLALLAPASAQTDTQTDARQPQLTDSAHGIPNFKDIFQEDGGVLAKKPKWADFQVGVLQDFIYESNANFDGNSGDGAFSYSPTVFAAANAKINSQWRITSMATWSSVLYEGTNDLDFWGVTGAAYANYRPWAKAPEFFTGAELNRYESWDSAQEISKSVSAVVGLRNTVQLGSTTGLFYHMRYAHRWSDPALFDRDQVNAVLGLNQRLAPGLFFQPSYSFGYYDYTRPFSGDRAIDREDFRHEFALALVYRINTQLSLRLAGSFVDNDSSLPQANYQNFSTGLNSGLVFNF